MYIFSIVKNVGKSIEITRYRNIVIEERIPMNN